MLLTCVRHSIGRKTKTSCNIELLLSSLFGTLNKSSSLLCTSWSLSPVYQSLLCPDLLFPLQFGQSILEVLTTEKDGRSFTEAVHRNEITSSSIPPRYPSIGQVFVASALS